jgi:phage tail-like protein
MTAEALKIDAIPNYRFYVEIDQVSQAVFTEVSSLQIETDVMEYAEGGNNSFVHRLPGRTKISNITLKRGMTTTHQLLNWYMHNLQGKIEPRNVSVVMFDAGGNEVLRWNLINAVPIKWIGPQLNSEGAATAIETLELVHEGLSMEHG